MSHFRPVPSLTDDHTEDIRRMLNEAIRAINLLGEGKSGNDIEVTLTANSATTTVVSPLLGHGSQFTWDPLTANARAELANGPPYAAESARLVGSVTFTHENNAQEDRTFRMCITG